MRCSYFRLGAARLSRGPVGAAGRPGEAARPARRAGAARRHAERAALEGVKKVLTAPGVDVLSYPGRCLTLLSHHMLYRCRYSAHRVTRRLRALGDGGGWDWRWWRCRLSSSGTGLFSRSGQGRLGGLRLLGDAGRALRTGTGVDASSLSNERRARMLTDIARAHAQLRHVDDAVATVRQAEDTAPQIVRGHPAVRQLVSDLHAMQNPPGTALSALAGRLTAPLLSPGSNRRSPLGWLSRR
jgi:hypothetical protein